MNAPLLGMDVKSQVRAFLDFDTLTLHACTLSPIVSLNRGKSV